MLGLKARRLHRFLRRHPEIDNVQQHLQHGLVLVVAARRRKREERLAVFQDDRRAQRHAGPLGHFVQLLPVLPGILSPAHINPDDRNRLL